MRRPTKCKELLIDDLIATIRETQKRKYVFDKLKQHLKVHADAEERFFYNSLFAEDLTQDQARHSAAEHQEIDELLAKLGDTEMDSSSWMSTAEKLKERVLHHLEEEEKEVFQMAGKALEEPEKKKLT